MEILHLTDLHVTPRAGSTFTDESLATEWSPVAKRLSEPTQRQFDFIVISGDLVTGDGKRCAAKAEYDELLHFAQNTLLRVLRKPDCRRIIFVPGNHDVVWGPVGPAMSLSAADLARYRSSPTHSGVRLDISDDGRLNAYAVDAATYPQRFQLVQDFLTRFYGGPIDDVSLRTFNLLDPKPTGHWSAHVFREEKVAFYGFNSCLYNDKFWRGASLDRAAVEEAARHASAHAHNCQRIAVWHHGLIAERGNPDYLTLEELGYLLHNGFTIGMHGHTHQEELQSLEDLLPVRFPVVATGSFGAGPHHRPDGYANQFAVLHLNPTYLQVERFFRRPNSNWQREMGLPLTLRATEASRTDRAEAATHERIAEIDERDGIARITVRIEALDLDGELTLAVPSGAFSDIDYDNFARTNRNQIHVVRHEDRPRFTVTGRGRFEWLEWSYRISNTFALWAADLELPTPSAWAARLGGGTDWAAHTVRFHCQTLRLGLRVVESLDAASRADVTAKYFDTDRFEMRVFAADDPTSTEDPEDVALCRKAATASGLTFDVQGPTTGRRYVLVYRPNSSGRAAPPALRKLTTTIADQLRHSVDGGPIGKALQRRVESELKSIFGEVPERWYAYLWHEESRRLVNSFGRFGRAAIASSFEYGRGVIGHAFRFCRPASYRRKADRRSLIFRPPERSGAPSIDWVVAVPALVEPQGPAVGILAFAGHGDQNALSSWEKQLLAYADLASIISQHTVEESDEMMAIENKLIAAITVGFWDTIAQTGAKRLADIHVNRARRIRDAWVRVAAQAAQ